MKCRPVPLADAVDDDFHLTHDKVVPKIGVIGMILLLCGGTLGTLYFGSFGREQDAGRFYIMGSMIAMFFGYVLVVTQQYIPNNVFGLTCVYFMDDRRGSAMSRISCVASVAAGKVHFRFPLSGWWQHAVVIGSDSKVIKHLRLRKNNKRRVWTLTEDDGCNAISDYCVGRLLATFISCNETLGSLPSLFPHQAKEIAQLKQNVIEARDSLSKAQEQHLVTNRLLDSLGIFCAEAVIVSGRKGKPVKGELKIGAHAGSFAARLLSMTPEARVGRWFGIVEERIKQGSSDESTLKNDSITG